MGPKLRNRNGRAIVTLRDSVTGKRREYPLGSYGSVEAEAKYHSLMSRFNARGKRLEIDHREELTVAQLVAEYWQMASVKYQPNHLATLKSAAKMINRYYGDLLVNDFGPLKLQELRGIMEREGLDGRAWARGYINSQVNRTRSMFKWGVSQELVKPETLQALQTVGPLVQGQTTAHETEAVEEADLDLVAGSIEFMSKPVRTMVELQMVSGARPGEIVRLRMDWVTKHSDDLWIFTIPKGQAKVRFKPRPIPLGPRAIRAIEPFIDEENPEAFLFKPADSLMELMGYVRGGARAPKPRYTTGSYRDAIQSACDKAFPPPEDCENPDQWVKDHRWSPNQLRHWSLTEIEYNSDDKEASIVAGHSKPRITNDVYIHRAARHFERIIEKCAFMREG